MIKLSIIQVLEAAISGPKTTSSYLALINGIVVVYNRDDNENATKSIKQSNVINFIVK